MKHILIECINFFVFFNFIFAQTTEQFFYDYSDIVSSAHKGIQLEKFTNIEGLRHGLRSGPIIIVNKNTIFVSNLHYDGQGPDAHFWVGKGSVPDKNGILVPDENNSNASLQAYNGQNVEIRLPDGITTDSIDYFGLWCIKFNQNFGSVTIPKNITVLPTVSDPHITINNNYIIRIQKCCPMAQSWDGNKCITNNQNFFPVIDVRMSRMENYTYAPFINNVCTGQSGKSLQLLRDNPTYFLNGTITINGTFWNQDEYCIETCNLNNETIPMWKTVAIVCKSSHSINLNSSSGRILQSNGDALNVLSKTVLLLTLTSIYFII